MLGQVARLTLLTMLAVLGRVDGQEPGNGPKGTLDASALRLADEVRGKGWIVFSARSEGGDWDLFACRPDGSERRNVTKTPDFNEAAAQFSRDGRRLLFRRLPRDEPISGNHYGTQGELILASADGSGQTVFGKPGEYPWASWSPDGEQLACLAIKGISIVDVSTHRVVRTLPRKGFFQQMTWSPDGHWLSGVSNSFGASWSVARLEIATGAASAISGADCCTPDWFPESRTLIYSNRPAGQKENNGAGWTQLWMADADGKNRRLVYGEDGRHVYGGHVSPDGKYAIFTGNMLEDGDPGHSGSPMGLLRLDDAPVIGGESKELRKLHPDAKNGPVLALPAGWEPCWTFAEIFQQPGAAPDRAARTALELAADLHSKGFIAFSAQADPGDWDLFVMRPDGSGRRQITQTPDINEAGVRFSPDGRKILYYRIPASDAVDNNTYGKFDLVIADADGSNAVVFGRDFAWASWGPDGTQLACLDRRGVRIVDVASRNEVRHLPRKGIVQQLVWSPDGASFAGTANGLGPYWNIGRLDAKTGILNAVSETERYNCTPDWRPDSRSILYSRGIVPETGGYAEIWMASVDGKEKKLLCAEEGRHLYGACSSPDSNYLLFTRSEADLGKVDNSRTRLAIVKLGHTPVVVGTVGSPSQRSPGVRRGPILDLSWGWEPHWTSANLESTK